MITWPKRKPRNGDRDRRKREDKHVETMLDDALKNTFPASDPISIVQPRPHSRSGQAGGGELREQGEVLFNPQKGG